MHEHLWKRNRWCRIFSFIGQEESIPFRATTKVDRREELTRFGTRTRTDDHWLATLTPKRSTSGFSSGPLTIEQVLVKVLLEYRFTDPTKKQGKLWRKRVPRSEKATFRVSCGLFAVTLKKIDVYILHIVSWA